MFSVRVIGVALGLLTGANLSAQAVSMVDRQSNIPSTEQKGRISVSLNGVSVESALKTIARQADLQLVVSKDVLPQKNVTLTLKNVPVDDAVKTVLRGTSLVGNVASSGLLTITKRENAGRRVGQGVVTGRITDAKTGKGVSGATVSAGGDNYGVTTGEDGVYRLTGIASGTQTVTVRLVGYAKQSRSVAVGDGATVTADFKLEPSANVLDQVVVTGTIISTELKAVPSAITVITAKQIEERGITRIDQLFRGDIPGLFAQNQGSLNALDEVTMFSRGPTKLDINPSDIRGPTNPIKTYVDGVELADPRYLSQIDPKSIERIEILTGPQASTVYGSNAINGVMQVFTKRGTAAKPIITASLLSGFVENNFRSHLTPQHDYSGQVGGTEGRVAYNVGGSWYYLGPWTPAKQTARLSFYGGSRMQAKVLTADFTIRHGITRNKAQGSPAQVSFNLVENGQFRPNAQTPVPGLESSTLTGKTLGLALNYTPISWWSHEFGVGTDASDIETLRLFPNYSSTSDTLRSFRQSRNGRTSLRYTTTLQIPLISSIKATLTGGGDSWQNLTGSTFVSTPVLTGSLTGSPSLSRQPSHNTGAFFQGQAGFRDVLFVTYGLRAEWNPNYGDEVQPNLSPRYGVAYTHEVGAVTAKLRASYGKSTRPPSESQKLGTRANQDETLVFGPVARVFASPDLGPEFQQGGEGGIELYMGNRGSLVITRYNQTVDALIALPQIDSVRSLVAYPGTNPVGIACISRDVNDFCYYPQSQYLNIGSLRNQGWELQSSVNVGALVIAGTYSWTKSRVIGITPKYRALFSNVTNAAAYKPGAVFNMLPEHTWSFNTTYSHSGTTLSLNVNGTGLLYRSRDDLSVALSNVRINNNAPRNSLPTGYRAVGPGYSMADLNLSHRFSSIVEGLVQVRNLTDFYQNDRDAVYATMGRQSRAGVRIKM